MTVTVHPSSVQGIIKASASKSSMQRACALALLSDGETTILNPGKSNDDMAALDIIQKLGARIIKSENDNLIISGFEIKDSEILLPGGGGAINCGESGLGIRMFAPIAALSSKEIVINGEGSLLKRPMHFFDEVFPQVGVSVRSNNGFLPVKIKGPLQPVDISIDGSLSSQFLTGLLMAYGKAATKPVSISVKDLKSKPYIDLTLQMMKQFGYEIRNNNYESFLVRPRTSNPEPRTITVEADWSGSAFLLVAGAIAGKITVEGLDMNSAQADKAIIKALKDCGTHISVEEKKIMINPPPAGGDGYKAFQFDATDCPDLFPPLVALAAFCKGTSVIEGVSRLLHKESNRARSLQQEFGKMGVEIKLEDDKMMITGGKELKGTTVYSHHDHRIAMACAVAALKANGKTVIEEAGAVNKSYPDFYKHLLHLNASSVSV